MFEWLKLRRHSGESDLSAYLDQELSAARRQKVEEHLHGCPACQARLAELRTLKQTLRSLPEAAAPRSFALTPEQARRPQPQPAYAIARVYPVLRNAAAAAAVLFFAFVAADVFVSTTGGEQTAERGAAALQGSPEDLEAERSLAGAGEEEAPDERKEAVPTAPALSVTPAAAPSEAEPGTETTPPALALTKPGPTAPEYGEREAAVGEADAAKAAEEAEEDGGSGWLRPLESVLGGAAIALVAAALILRQRRRLT